MFRSIL